MSSAESPDHVTFLHWDPEWQPNSPDPGGWLLGA
jgi:hypothetical protein